MFNEVSTATLRNHHGAENPRSATRRTFGIYRPESTRFSASIAPNVKYNDVLPAALGGI